MKENTRGKWMKAEIAIDKATGDYDANRWKAIAEVEMGLRIEAEKKAEALASLLSRSLEMMGPEEYALLKAEILEALQSFGGRG